MPKKEAKESCQPKFSRLIGVISKVSAATKLIKRSGENLRPTYPTKSERLATSPYRVIDGVKPTSMTKKTIMSSAAKVPANFENFPKSLFAILVKIPRCAPEATTTCVIPTICRVVTRSAGNPVFMPIK